MSAAESAVPSALEPAIEFLAAYCDIRDRLSAVPPSARVRGLYFKSFEALLKKRACREMYDTYLPSESWAAMRLYPLRDYLVRLAMAGAALENPERVHDGMFEIWRLHAVTFASSLLGRTMLRLLSRDPVRLTEQAVAARRQTFLYGHWETVRLEPRRVEVVYREEYVWIESAVAGGAIGALLCGTVTR